MNPAEIHSVFSRPPQVTPLRLRPPNPCEHPISNQIALELCDRRQYMEQQPPRRRCGVNCLIEDDEVHAESLEFLRKRNQMMGTPGEPIELCAGDYVNFAAPNGDKKRVEGWPALLGP